MNIIRHLFLTTLTVVALAQGKVVNIYSARHYQSDELLYEAFTRKTGIEVKRIEGGDAGLIARLKAEGSSSPADVVILVDASQVNAAHEANLFKPIQSSVLDNAIPETLRAPRTKEGITWSAFTTRTRVIVYDPLRVRDEDVQTYEQLGFSKLKGLLCTRSGSHPYNLSLFAMVVNRLGPVKGEQWLQGLVSNMARPPQGGDIDQIRAIGSGEAAVTIANSYYVARLLKSIKPEDIALMKKVKVVIPNQATTGAHVNICGAAVARYSPNTQEAKAFLEYLASPEAQILLADGNNEFPAAKGVQMANPALLAMGAYQIKQDATPLNVVAKTIPAVQLMLDRVGYR